MAAVVNTRSISISSSTPTNRNSERNLQLNFLQDSSPTDESMTNIVTQNGVPVKFADHPFSVVIKDQISQLLNLPDIKHLKYTDENEVRIITFEITEIIKRIVAKHVKENYKVVIQVLSYPKEDENNILIMSRCFWNYRTDDVLSLEIETDIFKFLIVIHGVVA